MQIRTLPATAGPGWIRDGARLFGRQSFALAALSAFYLVLVVFPATLGGPQDMEWLGSAVAGFVAPYAALGMMAACREVANGRTPTPAVFFSFFKSGQPRQGMMILGLWHVTILLVVVWLIQATGIDDAIRVIPSPTDPNQIGDIAINRPHLLVQVLIFLPLEMAMWFAPVYVGWHRVEPVKALFFSLYTCWRNRWPMLLYAVVLLAMMSSILVVGFELLAALGASDTFVSFMWAPAILLITGFVMTTLYPIYTGIVADAVLVPPGIPSR